MTVANNLRVPDRTSVVVLLSGSGRTLENLVRKQRDGQISVRFARVISSRSAVRGVQVAQAANIPLSVIPRRRFETTEEFSDAVHEVLDSERPDLVLMAGFLSKIAIPDHLTGRVMNIHPALLPLFGGKGNYGGTVHRRVLESGMKVSGCTVHFVDKNYDAGPIILQSCVPVHDEDNVDTLAARVFERECELYPEAVRLFSENRLKIEGTRVRILPPS